MEEWVEVDSLWDGPTWEAEEVTKHKDWVSELSNNIMSDEVREVFDAKI